MSRCGRKPENVTSGEATEISERFRLHTDFADKIEVSLGAVELGRPTCLFTFQPLPSVTVRC